jgi:ATP-dependent exoDNAse (exonuclease V) alpha subunit
MSEEYDVNPASIIKLVQEKRLKLLLEDIEVDKDRLLLMRDLANTALKENQIMVEEGGVKAQKELAEALANLVTQSRTNPFQQEGGQPKQVALEELPEFEISDDECAIEAEPLNYETFMAKYPDPNKDEDENTDASEGSA